MADNEDTPKVEIHVARPRLGAAASGANTLLTDEHIALLKTTISQLVLGMEPPATPAKPEGSPSDGVRFEAIELELSFKLEFGSGQILKLIFDSSAEASISAKVTWARPK